MEMAEPVSFGDTCQEDAAELRDIAEHFEARGKPLQGKFLRSVADRHEGMQKEIDQWRTTAQNLLEQMLDEIRRGDRFAEALEEADRSLEQAAQLNPAVMAAHAAIRAALSTPLM
jgi:uncharacterized protein YukE